MPMYKPVIITTTVATLEQADKIAAVLLEKKLAACVQFENIISCYKWQGQVCREEEIRLVIKSARCNYNAVEKVIVQNHDYDCPQVLMQSVSRGFVPYLRWAKAQLGL